MVSWKRGHSDGGSALVASRGRLWTALFLVVVVVGILFALYREAFNGPVFDPRAYPTLQACMAAIPAEWQPGSLDRQQAEAGCRDAAERRAGGGSR